MVSLYNVVSADGYIARLNGGEDFIDDTFWPRTLEFLKTYDCVVMGRKTYEAIQKYEADLVQAFEELPLKKIVVTHDIGFPLKSGYEAAHTPEEILAKGENIVVTSGPTLNNYLLAHKLVTQIFLHKIPLTIGEGIKPYDEAVAGGIPVHISELA
jgi:dihydrofolate reductase